MRHKVHMASLRVGSCWALLAACLLASSCRLSASEADGNVDLSSRILAEEAAPTATVPKPAKAPKLVKMVIATAGETTLFNGNGDLTVAGAWLVHMMLHCPE